MHINLSMIGERSWKKHSTLMKTTFVYICNFSLLQRLSVFQAEELCYMNQRIGFQCFTETLFDDAGKHLFNGELDPRILISYYPDLRGSLFSPQDSIDMFAAVAEHMPKEPSVDDISKSISVKFSEVWLALVPNFHRSPLTCSIPHNGSCVAIDV